LIEWNGEPRSGGVRCLSRSRCCDLTEFDGSKGGGTRDDAPQESELEPQGPVSGIPEDSTEHRYPGFTNAEYRDWIRRKGRIPALAQRVLELLHARGLHATLRSDEMHLVRLERGQTFWLEFEGRDHYGLPHVGVYSETQKDDAAILAALTVNQATLPTDMERLRREVLPRVGELMDRGASLEVALQAAGHDRMGDTGFDYRVAVLQYFRPELAEYPHEEQISLYEETCQRINELLEASRKLADFLEFGRPGRDLRPEREDVARDLRAAVLKDAGGLAHRQIGERLGIPAPPDASYKGDYPTVRQMVRRGREVLERTFGVEGWRRKAGSMKAEAEQMREETLSLYASLAASELDMTEEEVRRKLYIDPIKDLILDDELRSKLAARRSGRPQED
jgi:hypothetical protein